MKPRYALVHRIRRYGWLAVVPLLLSVWLANVSRVGTRVEGCPDGCARLVERSEGPCRVMSLNLLHGFPRFHRLRQRLDLISEEILRQDPDVVCLQEVPWTGSLGSAAEYLAKKTGFNHVYLRANGNRWTILFEEGEAILSRYPLRDVVYTELRPQAALFEHRVVLAATVVTPWGNVRVFVTHLTNGAAQINHAQAASLTAFVARYGEGPAMVAGDFNATDDSPQIKAITEQWVDTYRAVHDAEQGFTCCIDDLSSDFSTPLEKRIDYIFLVPAPGYQVTVVDSRRVLDKPLWKTGRWQWASDHVGLVTSIRVGQ